jgi:hypothetical protein
MAGLCTASQLDVNGPRGAWSVLPSPLYRTSDLFARFHCFDVAQPSYQRIPSAVDWVHHLKIVDAND